MKKVFLILVMALVSIAFKASAQDVTPTPQADDAGYYISGAFTGFDNVAMTEVDGKYTYTLTVGASNNGFNIYDGADYITANMYGVAITERDLKLKLNQTVTLVENGSAVNFDSSLAGTEVLITFDPATMTVVATDPSAPSIPKYYIMGSFNDFNQSTAPEMTYEDGKYTYTLDAVSFQGILILTEQKAGCISYGAVDLLSEIVIGKPFPVAQNNNIMYFLYGMETVKDALVTFDPEAMTVLVTDPNEPVGPSIPETFYIVGGFNDWDIANAPEMSSYGQYKRYKFNSLPNNGFKIVGQRNWDDKEWTLGAEAENSVEPGVPQKIVAGDAGKNFSLQADVASIANASVLFNPEDMTVTVTGYSVPVNETVPEQLFVYGNLKGHDYDSANAVKGVKRGNTFTFSGIELDCSYRDVASFAFTSIQSPDREGEVAGHQYGPAGDFWITIGEPTSFGRNGYTFYKVANGCYKMVVDFDNHTVTIINASPVNPDQKYYIWGTFNDQNIEDATEMTFENGVYSYKFSDITASTGFMISDQNTTSAKNNYGVDNNGKAEIDAPLQLKSGNASSSRFFYVNIPVGETFEDALITFDSSDFTVTVSKAEPEPTYYLVGTFNNWDVANALQMTRDENGVYTVSLDKIFSQFKVVTERNWDARNYGAKTPYSIQLGTAAAGMIDGTDFGFADDVTSVENAVVSFNPDNITITVNGTAVKDQPELYVIGSMNDWIANDASKMSYNESSHIYTITEVEMSAGEEFRIASADFSINFGGIHFSAEVFRAVLIATSSNNVMDTAGTYDLSFNYITKLLTVTKSQVGIDTISAETLNGEAEIYTLQGRRVYGTPSAGIYIVVRNGKASKIVIR